MSTEITNEEPVLVLNDKKYIISEMTDLQKAFVIELNALEQDINTTRRSLVPKPGMTHSITSMKSFLIATYSE